MKLPLPNYLIVSLVVGVAVGYIVIDRYIDTKTEAASVTLASAITKQQERLVTIADQTKQIEPDDQVKTYISDCQPAKRDRFDVLLDKLSSSISAPELDELNMLFYQCGSYYSDVKSTMAGKLVREVAIMTDYITLHQEITPGTEEESRRLEMWGKVADAEQKNAQFFADLVRYQEQIILALKDGKSPTGPEVTEVLKQAQTTREQMLVLNQQIDTYRKEAI